MANRIMNKFDDNKIQIWSPCCFWGDQMFNLMATRQLNPGKDVVIHTWKDAWCRHTTSWLPMDYDILNFWSSMSFVKGIIFDIDQRNPIEIGTRDSKYNIYVTLGNAFDSKFIFNIKDSIDFSKLRSDFPSHGTHIARAHVDRGHKIAVFQPISLLHREKKHIQSEYITEWDSSIEALLEKDYKILAIGGGRDQVDIDMYYPELLNKYNITNLIGKINMHQAIDLVINHASFVLSCDSWSAWYGIASRTKTAVAAGKTYRDSSEIAYIQALGNEDVYKLDYAYNKSACDANLTEWIKENG